MPVVKQEALPCLQASVMHQCVRLQRDKGVDVVGGCDARLVGQSGNLTDV